MRFRVLLIPGLGFTSRLFERLALPGCTLQPIEWTVPHPGESLLAYSERLLLPHAPGADTILLGHSFGGIAAQTFAAYRPVAGIVLVSSIKRRDENTWFFRAVAPAGLHHLFRRTWTLRTLPLWGARFGYPKGPEQDLFREMVGTQDDRYLQWALRELSCWRGPATAIARTMHVHGTADRVFPFRRIRTPVQAIPGGTHLMVWNRAEEVGHTIASALSQWWATRLESRP